MATEKVDRHSPSPLDASGLETCAYYTQSELASRGSQTPLATLRKKQSRPSHMPSSSSSSSSSPPSSSSAPRLIQPQSIQPESSLLKIESSWDQRKGRRSATTFSASLSSANGRRPLRGLSELAVSSQMSPPAGQSSRRTVLRSAREVTNTSNDEVYKSLRRTRQSSQSSRQESSVSYYGRPWSMYDVMTADASGQSRPAPIVEASMSPSSRSVPLYQGSMASNLSVSSHLRLSRGNRDGGPAVKADRDRAASFSLLADPGAILAPSASVLPSPFSPNSTSLNGTDCVALPSSTLIPPTPRKIKKKVFKPGRAGTPPPLPHSDRTSAGLLESHNMDRQVFGSSPASQYALSSDSEHQSCPTGSKGRIREKLFAGLRRGGRQRARSPSPSPAARNEGVPLDGDPELSRSSPGAASRESAHIASRGHTVDTQDGSLQSADPSVYHFQKSDAQGGHPVASAESQHNFPDSNHLSEALETRRHHSSHRRAATRPPQLAPLEFGESDERATAVGTATGPPAMELEALQNLEQVFNWPLQQADGLGENAQHRHIDDALSVNSAGSEGRSKALPGAAPSQTVSILGGPSDSRVGNAAHAAVGLSHGSWTQARELGLSSTQLYTASVCTPNPQLEVDELTKHQQDRQGLGAQPASTGLAASLPSMSDPPSLALDLLPSPHMNGKRPKGVYARPLTSASVNSSGSWKVPLPRASSLPLYDAVRSTGEAGPFLKSLPRPRASSQQGHFCKDSAISKHGADLVHSPSPRSTLLSPFSPPPEQPKLSQSLPLQTLQIANPVGSGFGSSSGTKKSGSVALLASKFGGVTNASLQRANGGTACGSSETQSSPAVASASRSVSTKKWQSPRSSLQGSRSQQEVSACLRVASSQTWPNTHSSASVCEDATQRVRHSTDEAHEHQSEATDDIAKATPETHEVAKQNVAQKTQEECFTQESSQSSSVTVPAGASTCLAGNPSRPAKSPLRPRSARGCEKAHGIAPLTSPAKPRPAKGLQRQETLREIEGRASTRAISLGSSPLRSSIEQAATFSLEALPGTRRQYGDERPGDGSSSGKQLDSILQVSEPGRSRVADAAIRYEALSDSGQQPRQAGPKNGAEEDDDHEGDVDEKDMCEEANVTPGGTRRTPGRKNRLRKATSPALASAFRPRKPSAGEGTGTIRSKKWPFSLRDGISDAEEEPSPRDPSLLRSARASIRRKKYTKARPQIRRIYDAGPLVDLNSETESTVAEHSPESDRALGQTSASTQILAHQQSMNSLQSVAASSCDGTASPAISMAEDRDGSWASPVLATRSSAPGIGGIGPQIPISPATAWTKGELDAEKRRILKRRNVIQELIRTERSYASDLSVVRNIYLARARAKAGIAAPPPVGTPWSALRASTPNFSPLGHPSSSSGILPYRHASAFSFARNGRSASGEMVVASHPHLRRKVSSPAVASGSIGPELRNQPVPSPSLSGTLSSSARSSFATSCSTSISHATDSMVSSAEAACANAVVTPSSSDLFELQLPSTPPVMTVTATTSSTSMFESLHSQNSQSTPHKGATSRTKPIVKADGRNSSYGTTRSGGAAPSASICAVPDAPFSSTEIRIIFAGVEMCASFAEDMCALLESAMGRLSASGLPSDASALQDAEDDSIGSTFRQLAGRIQQVYGLYCSKHEAAISKLQQVSSASANAAAFLKDCTGLARKYTTAWDLASLLIKPVQRMLKYPLLLQQILAATPESHPDHENLVLAVEEVQRVADSINELNRRKEIIAQIIGGRLSGSGPGSGGGSTSAAFGSGSGSRIRSSSKLSASKTVRRGRILRDKTSVGSGALRAAGSSVQPAGATLAASSAHLLEGAEYGLLVRRLEVLQHGLDTIYKEALQWPMLLKTSYERQLALLRAWSDVYALSDIRVDHTERSEDGEAGTVKALIAILESVLEGPWVELDRSIRCEVVEVIEKARKIFEGPRAIVERRNEREDDYAKYRAGLACEEKALDCRVVESANGFAALQMQLLDELPAFLYGVESIVDAILARFARLQSGHLARMKRLLEGFATKFASAAISSTADGATRLPATETVVRRWWASHQPAISFVESLGICGSSRMRASDDTRSNSREVTSSHPCAHHLDDDDVEHIDTQSQTGALSGSEAASFNGSSHSPVLRHIDSGSTSRVPSEPLLLTARSSTDRTSFLSLTGSGDSPQAIPRLLPASSASSSRKGSTAGSLLRSISGTFRSASSSGHANDADLTFPSLPSNSAHMPPVPPKDRRLEVTDQVRHAPMLPTLDLGDGDLTPELRVVPGGRPG